MYLYYVVEVAEAYNSVRSGIVNRFPEKQSRKPMQLASAALAYPGGRIRLSRSCSGVSLAGKSGAPSRESG